MPRIDSFSWVIWLAVIVSQPTLAALLCRGRAWRRWPSLFALIVFLSIQSILLLYVSLYVTDIARRAYLYFWIFWGGSFFAYLIQVWVLVQIASDLVGVSARAKIWIGRIIPAVALLNLVWASALAAQVHSPAYSRVVTVVGWADRSIDLAWLCTFLIVAFSADLLGIQWTAECRAVALGFALDSLGSVVSSWASLERLVGLNRVSDFKSIVYLAAIVVWGRHLPSAQAVEALPSPQALNFHLSRYIKALKFPRGSRS